METSPIEFSAERIEIGKALLKAQANIAPLKKTESNPLYGSKYADLAGVIEAIKAALQEAGIVLMQGGAVVHEDGVNQKVAVETILLHAESGQWARNILTLIPVPDVIAKARDGAAPTMAVTPQTVGKTLTYGRRYGLQALMGIAAEEDDDGNAASQPKTDSTVREYKLEKEPARALQERTDGLTEISGKLTNWREKRYPPDQKNPEGAVLHFGNINMWTIWTKEEDLVAELAQAQGTMITVQGKRSKNKENMFEAVSWAPAEESA